jgi:hypothetical protein
VNRIIAERLQRHARPFSQREKVAAGRSRMRAAAVKIVTFHVLLLDFSENPR